MTEIPEHLRKRAAQARQKAATANEPSSAPSKIPAHLLERAKAAQSLRDYADPSHAEHAVTPGSTTVPGVDFVCDLSDDGPARVIRVKDDSGNGPLIAVMVLLVLIISVGALLFFSAGSEDPGTESDPVAVETTISGAVILPSCESLASFGYTGPKVSCLDSSGNLTTMGQ